MCQVIKEVLSKSWDLFCDQWLITVPVGVILLGISVYLGKIPNVIVALGAIFLEATAAYAVCFACTPFMLLKERKKILEPERDKPSIKVELGDHIVYGSFLRAKVINKNGVLIKNARLWRFGLPRTVQDVYLRRQGDQIGPVDIQNGDEPVFDIANAPPKSSRLLFMGYIGDRRIGGDEHESVKPGTYSFTLRLLSDNLEPMEHPVKISLATGEGAYRITIIEG